MSEGEKKMVNFRVEQSQKRKWDEHVEESNEYTSLSQLIRLAVERQINEPGRNEGGLDAATKDRINELVERSRQTEGKIDRMQDRLETVEKHLQEAPEDIKELAGEVFDVLPQKPSDREIKRLFSDETTPVIGDVVESGKIEDIAGYLDEKEYEVRRAIENLQQDTSLVGSVVIDEQERFFREG